MTTHPSPTPPNPFVLSAVNGMKIPLLPGQDGILHRFAQKENRLVVASTSEPAADTAVEVSAGTPDPMLEQALRENEALRTQATAQSEALAQLQAQMAQLLAAQPAVQGKAPSGRKAPAPTADAGAPPVISAAADAAATQSPVLI